MITPEKIEQIRVAVFAKTGSSIAKDDPLLLNAAVIEATMESHVAQVQRLTDAAVGGSLSRMEQSSSNHLATLKKLQMEHANNIEQFLAVFERTIGKLNKQERMDVQAVLASVEKGRKSLVVQIWLAALIVVGAMAFLL